MAKNSLPSVDGGPVRERPQMAVKQQVQPIVESPPYMARRVDVKLPLKHREILHAKLRQLQDSGACLQDGTEVSDKTKAVLWILENEVVV